MLKLIKNEAMFQFWGGIVSICVSARGRAATKQNPLEAPIHAGFGAMTLTLFQCFSFFESGATPRK
jgi:hypothetical protein